MLCIMEKIIVSFPDGNRKEYPNNTTVFSIGESISKSLVKNAAAAVINDQLVDLSYKLHNNAELSIIKINSNIGLQVLRQTAALILAQAVKRVFPKAQLHNGEVTENGFYYDFKLENPLSINDLEKVQKEMKKITKENVKVVRKDLIIKEARQLFLEKCEYYKLDALNEEKDNGNKSIYEIGEFVDLSEGPFLPRTEWLKEFQLTNISGVYLDGDSTNEVLQRIYGVAFATNQDLNTHLQFLDEARKRDHRKLGVQLDLFMFSEEAAGMPFYLPNGQIIRNELEQFSRDIQNIAKYEEVRTPFMMNQRLWEQSGHWNHYKDNMYFSKVDETSFALKPMNCPGHMLIFKNSHYSYRDLPIRYAEFGQVHRHEYSGALNGMLRVRTFCQDDAHIFLREDQIEQEIKMIYHLIDKVYQTFGFQYSVELSTRPEDSLGDDLLWEASEKSLKNVLDSLNIPYRINEGDGAFYGPKIDFHIKDALNRSHQCGTIQLDFQMPEKFGLTYINEKNEKVRPVVIHRAIYGSIDRFFAILIEHFAGSFPVWLAPVQVLILPIAEVHNEYSIRIQKELQSLGIRAKLDDRKEKLGYKMREGKIKKIPYILVIGDHEVKSQTVNIRKFTLDSKEDLDFRQFKISILQEIKEKR